MNSEKIPSNDCESPEGYLLNTQIDSNTDNLIGDLVTFLKRFVAYPSEDCAIAHALWIIHAHLVDCFESTPRLAFMSPEKGSGKTRALEITQMLVPNPVMGMNVTAAYMFREIGDSENKPTILFDELDTVFGPKAKDNEELRGLLNSGHRKGQTAGRCTKVGGKIVTENFPSYCAVALAGLGNLPDTILGRSIVVNMRRRSPNEKVEAYRQRLHDPEGETLYRKIAFWSEEHREEMIERFNDPSFPRMPEEVTDRDADVWEALIAIADLCSADWASQARVTAVTLVTASQGKSPSQGIKLLSNIRDLFVDRDSMFTEEILNLLTTNEELPWHDRYGKPLDARKLSKYLERYEVKAKQIRIDGVQRRGYEKGFFKDAWDRYLPSSISAKSVTSVTSVTNCPRCADEGCGYCEKE
jgi:hypothetical protein